LNHGHRGIEKRGVYSCIIREVPWGLVLEVVVRTLPPASSAEKAAG